MSKKPSKNAVVAQAGDSAKPSKGLTVKEQLFVDSYLGEAKFNATEAARLAGYKGSVNTLSSVGYENLRKPEIAAQVLERLNESAMSANEVLARLSKHARGRLVDLLNEDGQFDLSLAEKRDVADLLKKLKVRTTTRRTREGEEIEDVSYEYEIHDPQAALVHLGKYHKLFADRVEHSNPDGSPLTQPIADALIKVYGNSPASNQ